jgi:pilus assembly protein Flp/PilA
MRKFLQMFRRDEKGATAIEYGLIAGTMAVVLVGAFFTFGDAIEDSLETIADGISAVERPVEQ